MTEETGKVAPVVESAPADVAPAATATEAQPAPEAKPETDWRAAYQTLSRNVTKRDQRLEQVLTQNQALLGTVELLQGDVEALLKQTVGEDGLKQRQTERAASQERQQALTAAKTAQQFIPAAIDVMASTMRAAGVPEKDIESVFQSAANTTTIAEWSEATKSGTAAAIAKAKADESSKAAEQAKAKSQEEIQAEATAIAERTLRTKGIDKVDLGRGQSRTPERSFIERIRSIDRNTPEGEAQWQALRKDVMRGTLKT